MTPYLATDHGAAAISIIVGRPDRPSSIPDQTA